MNQGRKNVMLRSTCQILQEQVESITKLLRVDVPKALRQTYETGGQWHDNPHWEHTLADQQRLRERLRGLLEGLQGVTFIEDIPLDCQVVTVGSEVETINNATGEREIFRIVGPFDITYNPRCKTAGFVSCQSPIGSSLMGKSRKEEVEIRVPKRAKQLLILDIRPLS